MSSGPDGTTKICLSGGKSLVLGGSSVNSGTSNSGNNNTQKSDSTATNPTGVINIPTNNQKSVSPGPSRSIQTPVGSQIFGQNQHIADSNNVQVGQAASNKQQNPDIHNTAGPALTTQAIFGDNQQPAQTQSVTNSGGSNSVHNLNDSPHESTTIQNNIGASQLIQHLKTSGKPFDSRNTSQEKHLFVEKLTITPAAMFR